MTGRLGIVNHTHTPVLHNGVPHHGPPLTLTKLSVKLGLGEWPKGQLLPALLEALLEELNCLRFACLVGQGLLPLGHNGVDKAAYPSIHFVRILTGTECLSAAFPIFARPLQQSEKHGCRGCPQ